MQQDSHAAVWYDGKSAVEHTVAVRYRPYSAELRICSPDQINDLRPLAVWSFSSIRLLSGKLSAPSRPLTLSLEPDDGQRLIITDKAAVQAAAKWLGGAFAEQKNKRRRNWLLGAGAVWALCLLLYAGGSSIFSYAAQVIPRSWESSLGKSSRDSVIAMLKHMPGTGVRGVCEEGNDSPDLARLIARLSEGAPAKGYEFDLMVLDADFVNAFALPGGYMVVSTGLIRECASPDELAAVIAHEISHVTERHGTGGLLRQYVWESILRMMGVNDGMTGAIAQLVISSSFSRDDERAADALGVERLVGAGVNPMAMADFFGALAKDDEGEFSIASYVSTHPALQERQENIRRKAEELGRAPGGKTDYSPALDEEAWARLQALCPSGKKL